MRCGHESPRELSTWGDQIVAQAPRALAATESARHFFGAELRVLRERCKLSQDELGALVHVSGDLISKVEKALRWPPPGLAEACDAALGSGGTLARLWPLVDAQRTDRRTVAGKSASDVDNIEQLLQEATSSGTMKLRADLEGNVWADLGRRSFLAGTVAAIVAGTAQANGLEGIASTSVDDPHGFLKFMRASWPDVQLARAVPDQGADWNASLPGGRAMLGGESAVRVLDGRIVDGRVVAAVEDRARTAAYLARPHRGLVVVSTHEGDESRFFVLDSRTIRDRLSRDGAPELVMPAAYELDDLTYGLLWAVANYDDALQADDQALAEAQSDLKEYERLSHSAVSKEAAPGLNAVAHMWLGSDFCARHILRALPGLPEIPAFWTREQRGEEASAWLIFDHKYPYLQATTKALGGSATTRAFCVPEAVVRSSPRHERILLFLAVALMESLGIHAQFTADPAYEPVEGFVVAPDREAVIANWVRGDGMWHVDVTDRTSIVREFTNAAEDVGGMSIISGASSTDRLRALAQYLDLPWAWLIRRCGALGRQGAAGLIQPRSRLVSAAGIDAACRFVGKLPITS